MNEKYRFILPNYGYIKKTGKAIHQADSFLLSFLISKEVPTLKALL
ncbi:hypothetical protein P278_13620 [Zhouia amylolytica AD3]|uniref:Uncharacterized protein n=1 Tax=Zhouia amylolytica AD3 TaxID=1286632 RepID=W2UQ60_9FLAO|nr:hypothetical protein P278_13620 [Zhouia amylolytica AD3]